MMNIMKHIAKKIIIGVAFVFVIILLTSIVLPYHSVVAKPPCVQNLKVIQEAKIRWMNINNKTLDDIPTWSDIKPLLADYAQRPGWKDGLPLCPRGGTYMLGKVGEFPRCSIGGPEHSIGPNAFPPPYHP